MILSKVYKFNITYYACLVVAVTLQCFASDLSVLGAGLTNFYLELLVTIYLNMTPSRMKWNPSNPAS